MRILLISQEVPPETAWGGIGTYVGILAPALAEAGHEVHVLSVVPGQARRSVRTDQGVFVHRAPLVRPRGVARATRLVQTWGRVSLAWAVAREVDRLPVVPHVIESPNWNAEGLLVIGRRRYPLVVRLHSWASQIFGHFGFGRLDASLSIRLEERLVRRADVVFGTQVQLDDAGPRLELDPEALRVIPPPVPIRDLTPVPPGRPTVCFVGRFEARKGPETLVRALPHLVQRVQDVHVVLAGRDSTAHGIPSYSAWLRALANELGVGRHVTVIDDRPDDDTVDALRRQATVCVMPSRWESFGYVAAEGLAVGRPVVASDIGGLREVVDDGETGFLVPPDDPRAWADALARLLRDPATAAAMGKRGAEKVRERFGPMHITGLTLEAYELARERFARRLKATSKASVG